jgi:hypothetical protein
MYVCVCVCTYVCMCMYACMYADCTVVLVSGDPLRSDVICHLVAVRGTPTRVFDRTDVPKVYTRFALKSVI